MNQRDHDHSHQYEVVVNEEEQYSIWHSGKTVPPGWKVGGILGTKDECLDYIESVWTDLRPLSVRRAMASTDPIKGPNDYPGRPKDETIPSTDA